MLTWSALHWIGLHGHVERWGWVMRLPGYLSMLIQCTVSCLRTVYRRRKSEVCGDHQADLDTWKWYWMTCCGGSGAHRETPVCLLCFTSQSGF